MEITKETRSNFVEVTASGRLDEHWSSHVTGRLDQIIREGAHHIRFNMAKVTYLSSAGIGVLVDFYNKLNEIDGSFIVTEPSPRVLKVLELSRLDTMLLRGELPGSAASVQSPTRKLETTSAVFEVVGLDPNASFRCNITGDPAMLQTGGYEAAQASSMLFKSTQFGIGLGAFGSDFEDCRSRYGEFLAVAGAAAYLPTDGSSVPDYIVSTGSLLPEVNVLQAITGEGSFASVSRFEASQQSRVIAMSEITDAVLDIAGTDSAALVMVAETTGLVGAALRRSPAVGSTETDRFAHPQIQRWISFTAEPAYAGSLCIIVGVATRNRKSPLAAMLRPMSSESAAHGHFHAAACLYRPIRKSEIDLQATVKSLMEAQSLQGILHLLSDPRNGEGSGQSEFTRGTCWIAPLIEVGAPA